MNSKIISSTLKGVRALCIVYVFGEFGYKAALIDGSSMKPTLNHHDLVITNQWIPIFGNIKRGDVVIFRSPMDPKRYHCKRVKGLEGDRVRLGFSWTSIPKGHAWLEGDNRNYSKDSRDYGPVPLGLIIGVAFVKIYPFFDAGFI